MALRAINGHSHKFLILLGLVSGREVESIHKLFIITWGFFIRFSCLFDLLGKLDLQLGPIRITISSRILESARNQLAL